MIYQVKDWSLNFENDRSRTRQKCSFVCVPNKQHGVGFARIMAEPDGAAIYGIWQMILGACSQQSLPRHGWLTENGESTGSPWLAFDLAMKFRRPEVEVQRALDFLTHSRIGWLVVSDGSKSEGLNQTHRPLTADSPSTHLEGRERREEKRRKEATPPFPEIERPSWDVWWAYCQMVGLGAEWKARDEWQRQESLGWKNLINWQAHVARVRSWWEADGRPMNPPNRKKDSQKPARRHEPNI